MQEIISIGAGLVDIFVSSPDLVVRSTDDRQYLCEAFGEKLVVDHLTICSGGAGTNTAVGFQRLGFSAAAVVEVGQDRLAEVVLSELEQDNVCTDYIVREKREQTGGSVILIGDAGGRTALVYRGAASELDPHDLPLDHLAQAKWIHLSSLGGKTNTVSAVFQQAQQYHTPLSWSPGKSELEQLNQGLLEMSDMPVSIMLLNLEEWQSLDHHHALLRHAIPLITVTDGARGGVAYQGESEVPFSSQTVSSVDDTGAGDAFAVGLVAAQLHGFDLTTSLKWGVANAVSVVQSVGAKPGLLRDAEIRHRV